MKKSALRAKGVVLPALVMALLTSALPAPDVDAQGVDAAVDKAARTYAPVKTMSGKIEQQVRNLLTGSQHITLADFQQSLPDRISVRFTQPAGDMLIADGKAVWIYTPSATPGVATKAPANAASVWVNMVGWLVKSPRERFTLEDKGVEMIGGKEVRVVSFIPRNPMPEMRKATAWIESATGIIRQIEVTEPSLIRRILFSELRLNGPVQESLFRFVVPRGVRVDEVR